jgi:hypothetical protein
MDTKQLIDFIAAAKRKDRRKRAKAPIMEKLRVIVRMQRMLNEIRTTGKQCCRVWNVEE